MLLEVHKMYSDFEKITIWNKGQTMPGRGPGRWRRDVFGRDMFYSDYGKRSSIFGWEIDHIVKKEHGGADSISNLRPLNWRSNLDR